MIKKLVLILIIILLPAVVRAQVMNVNKQQNNQKNVELSLQNNKTSGEQKSSEKNTDMVEKSLEEAPMPTVVTATEIIELETESKKSIKRKIKKQNTKERENFIDTINWGERTLKIRELMRKGKSYKEAVSIADEEFKTSDVNVKKDEDMERYIYKKGNFISNEK